MNPRYLLAACAAACLPGATQAQTTVTMSGIVDAAARHVSNAGVGSVQSLVSGSNATSRWVLRGQEDLGGGLLASFHLESGLALDTGAQINNFFDRRATVSLASRSLGELRLGRDFVPSYVGWSRFDPFAYVGVAGSNNLISATPNGPIRSTFGSAANTTVRSSNAIQYFLPGSLGGFEGQAMVAAREGASVANGGAKVMGVRLGWAGGPVSLSVAHTRTDNDNTADGRFTDLAAGATFNFGAGRVNLATRQFKRLQAKQTNLMLSGQWQIGSGEVKASVVKANLSGRVGTTAIDANDATQLGLGYVHNLSRRTALYASVARINNAGAATFVVPGGPNGLAGGARSTGYEAGLRHNF